MFTGDSRVSATNCSVLVVRSYTTQHTHQREYLSSSPCTQTVPQALEILLLSPSETPWASRLKYLILDEAHGITERDSGNVWEHILVLTRCPFLALSATIGNVDNFLEWLRAIKKSEVELVQHAERSTYQRVSVYDPTAQTLAEVNAVALATSQNLKAGLSQEWRLMPHQLIPFYAALAAAFAPLPEVEPTIGARLASLPCLERYAVLATACVAMSHPTVPEASKLNALLFASTKDALTDERLAALLQAHALPTKLPLAALLTLMSPDRFFAGIAEIAKNEVALYDNLLRRFCEAALHAPQLYAAFEATTSSLASAAKHTSTGDKALIGGITDVFTLLKKQQLVPAIVFSFDRLLCDNFCFELARHTPLAEANAEVRQSIDRLNEAGKPWERKFLAPLARGIAVHHAGCSDEYKMEVERLFRMKLLKIVFATGTLAQGIHMPCRTVVIAGDSPYLTAVSVRQIAGRAGRRGFDVTGNVVFYGIPFPAIRRLLLSPLPQVFGSLPVSPTYLLRLAILMGGKADGHAVEAVVRQLQQPLFAFGERRAVFQAEMQHHLRFSLEYLMREGHLSSKGVALSWSGMLTHLHYEEPSNLVLVRWLREGLFHSVVRSSSIPDTVQRKLVHILSAIFLQRPLRKLVRAPVISRVVLEPLPADFAASLAAYNKETRDLFEAYIRAFVVATNLNAQPERLPLSGASLPQAAATLQSEAVMQALASERIHSVCRSEFVALAGQADCFASAEEFVDTARSELLLDTSMLPTVDVPDLHNAFLLDFFKHGQREAIEEQNRVRQSEFDRLAESFLKLIKKVHTAALEQSGNNEEDEVVAAFCGLRYAFQDKLHPDWKRKAWQPQLRVEADIMADARKQPRKEAKAERPDA